MAKNEKTSDEPVNIEMTCIYCYTSVVKVMTPKQLNLMQLRAEGTPDIPMIQDILPDWSPTERELLISGICNSCYDKF